MFFLNLNTKNNGVKTHQVDCGVWLCKDLLNSYSVVCAMTVWESAVVRDSGPVLANDAPQFVQCAIFQNDERDRLGDDERDRPEETQLWLR